MSLPYIHNHRYKTWQRTFSTILAIPPTNVHIPTPLLQAALPWAGQEASWYRNAYLWPWPKIDIHPSIHLLAHHPLFFNVSGIYHYTPAPLHSMLCSSLVPQLLTLYFAMFQGVKDVYSMSTTFSQNCDFESSQYQHGLCYESNLLPGI